jgi:hypothetical protein
MKPLYSIHSIVQFSGNSGNFGPALNGDNSSIFFNGPVVLADNRAAWGAGGAIYLKSSNLTFNGTATIKNNTLHGGTFVSV